MDPDRTAFYLGGLHLERPAKNVEVTDVEVLTSPNVEYLGAVAIWPRDYWGGEGTPSARDFLRPG